MRSTFQGLEIGKRAIIAQQSALSTTGHNIANANTEGYTRQEAVLQATRPFAYPSVTNGKLPMQVGTGVEVTEFRRIREGYLDTQYRIQQQKGGYWEAKQESLSKIEALFNEPSDSGLQMTLDRFWQGMEDLSKQPDNLSARAIVRTRAEAVAQGFRDIYAGLDQNEKELAAELSDKEAAVNKIANQIGALNKEIAQIVPHGYQPNDLYDQRDLLLDQLSKLVNVQTNVEKNGMVDISTGGVQLVSGTAANTFKVNVETGETTINGNQVELESGDIKGLIESHGYMQNGKLVGDIPTVRENINQLVNAITSKVNAVHAGNDARNLDDIATRTQNPAAPLDQLLFFVDKEDPTQPPKHAGNITINPKIIDSLSKLAAAKTDHIGDGDNAKAMADLRYETMDIGGHQTTIGDFYKMIVGQVGINSQEAKQWSKNTELIANQIDNQRQSVSGVSIDEEMANMVRFQQAYNAAARYVSAVDEMLDKLINGI